MLVKTNEYEVSGNMPGHTEDMTLSSDSLEHIMDILSDLYSDRSAAVIREYATNALDSHIISGQTKPIEIDTPSRLNPNLVIRDFGVGMSKEVLINTYSKYGASTKRGNNIEAGQLGLGSKSGFAYTDQFTVRATRDGHCCEIIMSRNDRGAAEMNIALEYETTDPNGVTITIPISSDDVTKVQNDVRDFASYAAPGTILVNGALNQIPDHFEKIADNFYASSQIKDHMVVMGNVAYRANLFPETWMPWNSPRAIVFVNMGDVDFTPSREELKYTKHTVKTIRAIEQYIRDSLNQRLKEAVSDDAPRHEKIERIAVLAKWSKFVDVYRADGVSDLCAGTEGISAQLPYNINDPMDRLRNDNHKSIDKVTGKYSWDEQGKIDLYNLMHMGKRAVYAVTDFPGRSVTRAQAAKVLAKNSDFAGERVYFFSAGKDQIEDLFKDPTIVSWEDAKGLKVAQRTKRERVSDKQNGRYLGLMYHKRRASSGERYYGANGRTYFVSKTDYKNMSTNLFPREDFKLLFVTNSNQAAFKRKHPHAKSLTEYVKTRREQIRGHIKNSPRVSESLEWATHPYYINWVNLAELNNERLFEAVKKSRTGAKWSKLSGSYWNSGRKFEDMMAREYPLISPHSARSTPQYSDHAMQYVNMIGKKVDK